MNRHEQPQPGDDLRRVLRDAVDDVEPRPGLDAIRDRTREPSRGPSRGWVLGAFGAAVATAAVVAGVAVLGNDPRPTADPSPAGTPSGQVSPAPTGDPDGDDGTAAPDPGETVAVPVYFAGDTPQGTALYREFQRVDSGVELVSAANRVVRGPVTDPDYRTLWPEGSEFDEVTFDDEVIRVRLTDASLHDRPAGMSEEDAELAIEQVVYTLQGVVAARAPVQFLLDGNPVDTVLGVPTSEPVANRPQLEVLAHVNITSPEQGEEVSGMLVASGVASSFEGTVPLKVMRGSEVVLEDFATAEGWMGKLFPWQKSIDVASLPPGDYTLVASTDDPSGGAEGAGPHTDSKDFTIAD